MIEDQLIKLDGVEYEWSCRVTDDLPKGKPWSWSDAITYEVAASSIEHRLNRLFVEKHSHSVAQKLTDPTEQAQFLAILKAMKATDEQLRATGLVEILQELFLEKEPCPFSQSMPVASHSPFNCKELRDWFVPPHEDMSGSETANDAQKLLVKLLGVLGTGDVGLIGTGPFETSEFKEFLDSRGIGVCGIATNPGVIVLGREDWNKDEVNDLIDSRVGGTLRIYSQEMFVAFLAKRVDPLKASSDVLNAFKAEHAGLEYVSQGWSGWVSTNVSIDWRNSATASADSYYLPLNSMLDAMDYHAGKTGKLEVERREILRRTFEGELPLVRDATYTADWGEPSTSKRLHKIAGHLAWLIEEKSRQRDSERYQWAIEDWQSDLAWLKDEFYHSPHNFGWPDTSL